jgi:hypothetical protein
MKISEIITDKYKWRIPPTVYYELLADVVEAEEEQEPCGDAISRQKVLDVINLNWDYRRNCIRAIEKLPPVNPQEPSSSENDLLQRLRKRISDLYNTDVTYDNGDYNTMDTPTLDKVLEYFDSEVNA